MPDMPIGYSGLTAFMIVQQSALCHPDWTLEMHAQYLMQEEGINLEHIPPATAASSDVLDTIHCWINWGRKTHG